LCLDAKKNKYIASRLSMLSLSVFTNSFYANTLNDSDKWFTTKLYLCILDTSLYSKRNTQYQSKAKNLVLSIPIIYMTSKNAIAFEYDHFSNRAYCFVVFTIILIVNAESYTKNCIWRTTSLMENENMTQISLIFVSDSILWI
jgi:hypothetical protein